MLSDSCSEGGKNSADNVFEGIPIAGDEAGLFTTFLDEHDFSPNSQRAFKNDIRKFAQWFTSANKEPLAIARVTLRDVTDFREFLRGDQRQAVATVNRALVTVRKYFGWLKEQQFISINPAKKVKELKRQATAPKSLERPEVRKLLREAELRQDTRCIAIFNLFLFTGCRISDMAGLELTDLMIAERSGNVVFRAGKGNKQRTVPVPLPARRSLTDWLAVRPPHNTPKVFVGERGALTDRGIRNLCDKYSAICGFKFHPHLLRHTMAHQFMDDSQNDLVGLAQILGHENLNTTAQYTKRKPEKLEEAADRLNY